MWLLVWRRIGLQFADVKILELGTFTTLSNWEFGVTHHFLGRGMFEDMTCTKEGHNIWNRSIHDKVRRRTCLLLGRDFCLGCGLNCLKLNLPGCLLLHASQLSRLLPEHSQYYSHHSLPMLLNHVFITVITSTGCLTLPAVWSRVWLPIFFVCLAVFAVISAGRVFGHLFPSVIRLAAYCNVLKPASGSCCMCTKLRIVQSVCRWVFCEFQFFCELCIIVDVYYRARIWNKSTRNHSDRSDAFDVIELESDLSV